MKRVVFVALLLALTVTDLQYVLGHDSFVDFQVLELRSGPVFVPKYNKSREWRKPQLLPPNTVGRALRMDDRSRADGIAYMAQEWGVLRGASQFIAIHEDNMGHDARMDLLQHVEDSGCWIMGYLPKNGLLLVGTEQNLEKALEHSRISWALPYEARHKIAPEWEPLLHTLESTPGIVNSSLELASLPVRLMFTTTHSNQVPLVGIRALFPSVHKPKPQEKGHPHHEVQNARIEKWEHEHGTRHAGMAASKDWGRHLRIRFGQKVRVEHAGPDAAVVFVEPKHLRETIKWISMRGPVSWIEPLPKIRLMNRQASTITQSGKTAPQTGTINTDPTYHPVWAAGITGQGMIIGIGDSGLDYNHCFFKDPEVDWNANIVVQGGVYTFLSTTHRKIRMYRAYADFRDDNGHGTHTCGTLAGMPYGNTLAEASNQQVGMAPDAKLAFIDLSAKGDGDAIITPSNLENQYFKYTTDVGATVHSDSWGSNSIVYDAEAYQIDQYCWNNPTFLPVFPAGNAGDRTTFAGASGTSTINSPATAKNCLAVGATQTAGEVARYNGGVYDTSTGIVTINGAQALKFPVLASTFSPAFDVMGDGTYALVPVVPSLACSPITNPGDVAGKVALIERGSCTFVDKAENAKRAGAIAVIIYDDKAGAYFVPDANGGSVDIPVGFVPRRIGQNLIAYIEAGSNVQITFGAPFPSDIGQENLASFSSQGPVGNDKRIKPDVVAPGILASAKANTPCDTIIYGGTSMATPVTAGSASLIQQYFKDGYYPTGVASQNNGFMPSSALVKAVIMGGASPIRGYEADTGLPIDPPPSFRQGYGRVYLGGSLNINGNPYNPKGFQVLDSIKINTGDSHKYCIKSVGGALSITLAWTDYPGNPYAQKSLVNDLDLVVRAQGLNGIPMLGNGGDINNSSLPDSVNNVESVTFDALPNGTVSIEVRGTSVQPSVGPQPYALAVIGDFEGTLVAPSNSNQECEVVTADITSSPGALTNNPVVTFGFGLSSGVSTGIAFECKLEFVNNGSPVEAKWQDCQSPISFSDLTDGEYIFSVKPKGENSVASETFVLDTTPPQLQVSQTPSAPGLISYNLSTQDLTPVTTKCMLNIQTQNPSQAGVRAGEVVASDISLGNWFNCSSMVTMGWALPGIWQFAAQATDQAGNSSPQQTFSVEIKDDANQQRVYIIDGPFLTVPKESIFFSISAFQGATAIQGPNLECGTSVWQTDCTDPGPPRQWEVCPQNPQYGYLNGGKYTFYARIAGSTVPSSYAMSTFLIDEIAPTMSLQPDANGSIVSVPEMTLKFVASEDHVKTECKLVGIDSPQDSMDWQPCISPVRFANLSGGHYLFEVRGTDAVGNVGNATEVTFVVDLEAPLVTVNYQPATRQSTATFNFVADDGPRGSGIQNVTCQIVPVALATSFDLKDPAYQPQTCQSPWTVEGLTEGQYSVSIVATDKAGRSSVAQNFDFWVDTRAPVANITAGPDKNGINPGGTVVFNISVSGSMDAKIGSPVQWQGYMVKQDTNATQESPVPSSASGQAPGTAVKTTMAHHIMAKNITSVGEVYLGPGDLNKWANCSSSACVYSGLSGGTYSFTARGVDAAGNQGNQSAPYVFQLEGVSSGLPTWALIVIIVGSVVGGMLVLAILWLCCCRSKKKTLSSTHVNGAPWTNGNGHASYANGNIYGQYGTSPYDTRYNESYANGYPVAGARPFAGAVNGYAVGQTPIPSDPIAAQQMALSMATSGRNDDEEELKKAIEESLRFSQPRDDDLDAAIAASLQQQNQPRYSWSYR